MNKFTLATVAALLAGMGTAQAQQEVLGVTKGDWQIVRDASMAGGCYMQSQFADGTIVQLGYDKSEDFTFMTAINEGWTFDNGEQYDLVLDIDGDAYQADVYGIAASGMSGLIVQIGNEEFLTDLMKGNVLTLAEDGEAFLAYTLVGTMEAIPAVATCLEG